MYDNASVDAFPDIHDGFFDGVWISENKSVHIFLRTVSGERSTIVLKDVERMTVSNFLQGNILFDLVLVEPDKLTIALIEDVYQLQPARIEMAQQLLKKAQERGLSALIINPSYGAEGVVLFRGGEVLPNHVLPQLTSSSSA